MADVSVFTRAKDAEDFLWSLWERLVLGNYPGQWIGWDWLVFFPERIIQSVSTQRLGR
jgi:hypothetical protein